MAVTAVNPLENSHGGVDEEGNQTYTNLYDVYTDDKNDGSDTVRLSATAIALGLPAYNDEWRWFNDHNPYAICKTRSADLVDRNLTRKKWLCTIGYTSKGQKRDSAGGGGGGTGAPVDEPWTIDLSYAMGEKDTREDKDGKAIMNSAEEPKIIRIPSGRDTIILEGNTDGIDLVKRSLVLGKTNSEAMWGLQRRQLLLMQWGAKIRYKATVPYVQHHLEFWVAPDDELWNYRMADLGTRYIADIAQTDPNKRYAPFTYRDAQSSEGWLDGSGGKLNLISFPDGLFVTKYVIKERDFLADMPFLPNTLPGPFI